MINLTAVEGQNFYTRCNICGRTLDPVRTDYPLCPRCITTARAAGKEANETRRFYAEFPDPEGRGRRA